MLLQLATQPPVIISILPTDAAPPPPLCAGPLLVKAGEPAKK